MNSIFVEIILVTLLAVGCFFILLGSFSLIRLSDFFRRLHGPTKASTMGVGCVLLTSVGYHFFLGDDFDPRELLITAFIFTTAPISAHMMAKAALSLMMDTKPVLPNELPEAGETPVPEGVEGSPTEPR